MHGETVKKVLKICLFKKAFIKKTGSGTFIHQTKRQQQTESI